MVACLDLMKDEAGCRRSVVGICQIEWQNCKILSHQNHQSSINLNQNQKGFFKSWEEYRGTDGRFML